MIDFNCPHCEAPIHTPDETAGKVGACTTCKQRIQIPSLQTTTVDDPEPPPLPEIHTEDAAVWHVHTYLGRRGGPVDEAQIEEWAAQNRLTTECLLWQEGWEQWERAGDVFSGLRTPRSGKSNDPREFLAALGEDSDDPSIDDFESPVAVPRPVHATAGPTSAADEWGNDPYLVGALAGTRLWTVLFAVSACLLATMVLIGLAYIVGSLRGNLPSVLILPVIGSTLYVIVLYVSGILALKYNARIGAFTRAASSSRLKAALIAQRAFWMLLSISVAVFTLFVIFLLIQVIRLVNAVSDAAGG